MRYVPSASGYLPVGRYDDGHFAYYVLGMSTDRFNRPTVGFFIAGLPTAKTERTVVVSPYGTSAHVVAGWPCVVDVIVPGFLKSFYIQLVMCPSFNSGDKSS